MLNDKIAAVIAGFGISGFGFAGSKLPDGISLEMSLERSSRTQYKVVSRMKNETDHFVTCYSYGFTYSLRYVTRSGEECTTNFETMYQDIRTIEPWTMRTLHFGLPTGVEIEASAWLTGNCGKISCMPIDFMNGVCQYSGVQIGNELSCFEEK